jgi:hypothetical protein
MDTTISQKYKNFLYYTAILLLVISPYITANVFINAEQANEGGGAAGLAIAASVFLGIPFILIVGLVSTLLLKALRNSNKNRVFFSYLVPALLVNAFILV